MKNRSGNRNKTQNKLKWYTVDQVFKRASKKGEFQRAYREETARIKLARSIRETRISKKLTQAAVAKKAALPQSVIARIETGERGITVGTLGRVANALGKKVQLI